ncbi:MAG: YidC/Oxa1 family membrane protein insertase [Minisyncoccia bacterium]
MVYIFNLLIATPFYNGLVFLIGLLPYLDAGIIIIIFTIIVKIILLPLSIKASKSQIEMKSTEKDLQVLKEKYKENKNELNVKTMEYYKEKGINPFAGILIIIIQLPILIGLYRVFLKSGLPEINQSLLYSFVTAPTLVDMMFLGSINIAEKSLFLAIISGLTTYFQVVYATQTNLPASEGSTQNELARAMSMQMKYFFPLLMAFISYTISSAIALYIITSNIFAIFQEIYIRKKYHKSVTVV